MNREQKQVQINDFAELYKNTQLFVIAENRGLNAEQVTELRSKVFKTGGKLRVFKNTLVEKALGENLETEVKNNLVGPNTFLFGGENFVDDLKELMDFSKASKDMFVVKCGTLDGEYIDTAKLKVLSTLPGKDQLRAMLLGTMIAPVRGFVTALAGNITNLVNVINNIKEDKE